MTAIDGDRQPGTIPGLAPGALLDRIDELARLLHRSPMEVVILAFDKFAPPVETRPCTASPGDGRGAGGVAATPAPVSHAAPAHVHLGGGRCVYGERCGQ